MLNIKKSYIVTLTHITLTLGGLLVLIAADEEQLLEVKQDAQSHNKLYVELKYTDYQHFNKGSIKQTDYLNHCLCRTHSQATSYCSGTAPKEKIANIIWSYETAKPGSNIIWRNLSCEHWRYSFNVTTANIQVGLDRNVDGDKLNVTLVCLDTSNDIYVNGQSQQAYRIRINFSMEVGNTTSNIFTKFWRHLKQTVKWIVSFLTPSPDGVINFHCGEMVTSLSIQPITTTEQATTTRRSVPSDSPTKTISRATPASTLMTEPTTNLNSTELPPNEQDLILMVVIPVVAVVVIIIVIIIVVVICVRRTRKSSAPAVKYHASPTDPNYNRRSAFDEESDYNILGERVPVHCDEDDYDCPYSQNTKPRKPPVKTQPEGSTYEDVDHLDLTDQLDSSPGSNNSTKPLHQPDPSQLYSVVQKDRQTEDDQGIIMVENDLYE